jgi:5-methylcytosine-specific restriction enzyme subunit McrC
MIEMTKACCGPSNTITFTKEDFIPFNKITAIEHHECGIVNFYFLHKKNPRQRNRNTI